MNVNQARNMYQDRVGGPSSLHTPSGNGAIVSQLDILLNTDKPYFSAII